MSNANNFLQNMGMQMPMFTAANQQTTSEDVDLHDIFADYFNEDNAAAASQLTTAQQQYNATLQQQQQAQLAANAAAAQGMALPTGQGIKTAWHSGSLPAMQQQGQQQQGVMVQQPPAKKLRGEELLLPGQQVQMGAVGQQQSLDVSQQQLALAQAASGVGALSNRLGFTLPAGTTSNGLGSGSVLAQQQQQQQAVLQTQQATAATAGGMNLPIGSGMKFGAGGNIMSQTTVGGGMAGLTNGNTMGASNGAMNALTAAATQAGNASILTSSNPRVAVTNMQYGITPLSMGMNRQGVEDQMAAERRLRNREHAKRSRVRKKFMLESLQQQVRGLQDENSTLRLLVQKHIPQEALKIIDECCSKSVLFGAGEGGAGKAAAAGGGDTPQDAKKDGDGGKETQLLRSDFSLIESLTSGQQNFVLSDPRLPDNPIVFASPGFYELTGYTREQVLGRNCRFLQGAGTDRKAVDVIRTAVANGTDATVCLLNYRADGSPFWNQLFVAALRDADNCIVNYVGVQTMIEPNAGASALEDKVNAAHPITVGVEGDDDKDAK